MATVSLEGFLLHLINKAERSRYELNKRKTIMVELRTLEFWRAIIAECLATFFYVFLVCGSHVMWPLYSINTLTKSFANGLAMATTAQCFGHISGAHVNPAFTFSVLVTRKITPLRAFLYITAQCGGAIAGAALLYGVTAPSTAYRENLGCTLVHESLSPLQAMALELVLTFVVSFTMCSTADPNRRSLGSDSLAVGISYLVCSLVALPATGASMNPARSLGPAFVMNTWTNHWVYWSGPVLGGLLASLIYEYIFDTNKRMIASSKEVDESDRDGSESKDDTESKTTTLLSPRTPPQHNPPPQHYHPQQSSSNSYYRSPTPHDSNRATTYAKYNTNHHRSNSCYSSLPRSSYRGYNDYSASNTFKF